MTELHWHELGPAEDVPVGHLRRAELAETAVCVGRTAGGWVAFQDTCTHEECSLSDGELEGSVVVCPCHGSEFDLRTGDVLCPPALDPLPIYEARVPPFTDLAFSLAIGVGTLWIGWLVFHRYEDRFINYV